jgi:uncharacterized lipoprotein YajG
MKKAKIKKIKTYLFALLVNIFLVLDGNATYSNTLLVKLPNQPVLTILQNPVQNTLQLQINTRTTRKTNTLMLYDFSGRRLKTLSAPNGPQTIDVSALPAGTYILQLTSSSGQIFNQQFIKTN